MARIKKEGSFLHCLIRQELIERLNAYSEESSIPKTAIVEKALEMYLESVNKDK